MLCFLSELQQYKVLRSKRNHICYSVLYYVYLGFGFQIIFIQIPFIMKYIPSIAFEEMSGSAKGVMRRRSVVASTSATVATAADSRRPLSLPSRQSSSSSRRAGRGLPMRRSLRGTLWRTRRRASLFSALRARSLGRISIRG